MTIWLQRQHIAGVLGLVGGGMGLIVGIIQAVSIAELSAWTGNKADPVALGLLTIFLSAISVVSALALRAPTPLLAGQRLAAAAGLLIPGSLCFSTGGILWYLPGAVLVTAGVYAVIGGDAAESRAVLARTWPGLLLWALGALQILMAVSAGSTVVLVAGIVGGVALMLVAGARPYPLRVGLLLLGAVPFAALAWWSVAAPVLGVLALVIGLITVALPPGRSTPHVASRAGPGDGARARQVR